MKHEPRLTDERQSAQEAALAVLDATDGAARHDLGRIADGWAGDGLPHCAVHVLMSWESMTAGYCLRCVVPGEAPLWDEEGA